MSDLVTFLRARLDDDELAARNAGGEAWDFTGVNCEVRVREPDGDLRRIIAYCRHGNPVTEDLALAIHIARHDPARVLREVEVKRAILAKHAPGYPVTYPEPSGQPTCGVCHAGGFDWEPENWPCPTVRDMTAVYSDHPDYRQEWKP